MKMFHSTFFSECVGRQKTVPLVNVVQENRLETRFKGTYVKALNKTSNCENFVIYFSKTVQKIAAFAMLFFYFSDQKSLENVYDFPK